ncbi:single-stranded DNA-binding protein [Chamaesiphon sp.]|uniref:single-stranded DNA-binding protein n=1 Tax=Chamaesiphon sp. TaxID=2814140 RepID=UPI0035947FAA
MDSLDCTLISSIFILTLDTTDWYQLKFIGDSLVKAANYLTKGCPVSIVGDMAFEHWNDEDGNLRAKPVVTVSEIQLPPKAKAA